MDFDMLRPPANHAMRELDRAFFHKTVPLAAALVRDRGKIADLRRKLDRDIIKHVRLHTVHNFTQPDGIVKKGFLLQPGIKAEDTKTWSPILTESTGADDVVVQPHQLELDYNFWTYQEIMDSIFPQSMHDEYPKGFSIIGHVAHLNLRDQFLPYKHLIATILLDKLENLETVINKIDDVGSESQFRTFNYELLGGKDDLGVTVSEQNCSFSFDYSKVYWNPRLSTEHGRLVDSFQPGEVICDVMAGVGPFAVPAGKKRCWVLANDLNPHSHASLEQAIKRNKVFEFVTPFCMDGRKFIHHATRLLIKETATAPSHRAPPIRRSQQQKSIPPQAAPLMTRPQTVAHYVLNLPASAITFLSAFKGIYNAEDEMLFAPHSAIPLPMIHVYCFDVKTTDLKAVSLSICGAISQQLDHTIDADQVTIWNVRDVAPQKTMYCASFRLPAVVAFRS